MSSVELLGEDQATTPELSYKKAIAQGMYNGISDMTKYMLIGGVAVFVATIILSDKTKVKIQRRFL